jgi:hypothetical protein
MKLTYRLFSFSLVLAGMAQLALATPVLVHEYDFNGNLLDSVGSTAIQNNYGGTVGAGVFSFGPNQGPTLAAVSSLSSSYSIGLQFQLNLDANGYSGDTGNYWASVLNLSDLAYDNNNQYLGAGHLNFYNYTGNGPDTVLGNTPVQVLLSWDGTNYSSYLNGVLQNSFSSPGAADAVVVGGNAVFQFFQDDSHSGEAAAGSVTQIRVWNGALTGDAVAQAFDQVQSVPDGGTTAALLGSALLGLVALRRKFARA